MLAGLLVDARGEWLTPSHAVKKGRRYRYYVSAALITDAGTDREGWRLAAREIEEAVIRILADALDRHRGKGQQRITVEHVNVHAGGHAIVGAVTPEAGSRQKSEGQTGATRGITHEPSIPMRSPDPEWETMPIAAGARKAPV